MEYTLKFEMPYINCDNFKEKELKNVLGVITGTRINKFIDNYIYGNIVFDDEDKQRIFPKVTELNGFTRSKTNCIIFDVISDRFKKLFVYQTLNRENPFYGIVGLKNDGTMVHLYFLRLDYSDLVINMFRLIK